jgi:hypothetical protein
MRQEPICRVDCVAQQTQHAHRTRRLRILLQLAGMVPFSRLSFKKLHESGTQKARRQAWLSKCMATCAAMMMGVGRYCYCVDSCTIRVQQVTWFSAVFCCSVIPTALSAADCHPNQAASPLSADCLLGICVGLIMGFFMSIALLCAACAHIIAM